MTGVAAGYQREYFRLNLDPALCADMTIVMVKGKTMEIGSAEVLIEDLSAGGLRFLSNLKMPANDQLVLQFETVIFSQPIKVYGHVVRTSSWEYDYYEYAVRLTMEEAVHQELNRIVNRLAIRFRQEGDKVIHGRFLKGCRREFLQERAQVSQ